MIRQYQYEFSLDIGTIYLQQNLKGPIIISWANKSNSIKTKHHYRIQSSGKWCDIGQKLGMKGICKLNGRAFVSKIFDLRVEVLRNDSYEFYGGFPIDICSILNPNEPTKDASRTNEEYLSNYAGKVNYALSAKFIKQISPMSLDNTTTDFTNTRPFSRNSQNSAEFSFQLPSSGRDFRDLRAPSQEKQARSTNQTNGFIQQLEMKRNYDKKKEQLEELRKELARANDKIRALEGEKQQRNMNLMNEVNILSSENSELKKQIEHINLRFSQVQQSQMKIEEKNRRIQELEGQNMRKYNEYISERNRDNNKIKEITNFNERIHEQNRILSIEFQKSNERVKQLEVMKDQQATNHIKQIAMFETRCKSLEEKCREKEMGLERIKLQLDNSGLQRNNVLMKERDYKTKIEQLQNNIKRLQTENMSIKRLETENLSIKNIIKQVQNQYNEFKNKLQSKREQYLNKISALESQLAKKQAQLSDKNQLIQKAKLFIEQKDIEIDKRNDFIKQAKQYVYSKQLQLKQALEELQSYRNQSKLQSKQNDTIILKLKQQIISLKQQLRVSLSNGDTLRQQIHVKQKYLSEYLSDLAAENQKNQELERQIEYLRGEIEEEKEESLAKEEQHRVSLSDLIKQNVEYKLEMSKAQNQLKRMKEHWESRFD